MSAKPFATVATNVQNTGNRRYWRSADDVVAACVRAIRGGAYSMEIQYQGKYLTTIERAGREHHGPEFPDIVARELQAALDQGRQLDTEESPVPPAPKGKPTGLTPSPKTCSPWCSLNSPAHAGECER